MPVQCNSLAVIETKPQEGKSGIEFVWDAVLSGALSSNVQQAVCNSKRRVRNHCILPVLTLEAEIWFLAKKESKNQGQIGSKSNGKKGNKRRKQAPRNVKLADAEGVLA